jgi:hypothetical protein
LFVDINSAQESLFASPACYTFPRSTTNKTTTVNQIFRNNKRNELSKEEGHLVDVSDHGN